MNKIEITKDTSPTVFNTDLNARYHSIHGALQESKHVFIQNGVDFYVQHTNHTSLKIIEVGFGTGLNCWLTFQYFHKNHLSKNIQYIGIEKYPLEESILKELIQYSPFCENQKLFFQLHLNQQYIKVDKYFTLLKYIKDINAALSEIEKDTIDIVFYDAFAPSSQPDMWKKEIFETLYTLMKKQGVLVTFCAKGAFKRTLKQIGYFVESPKGAFGKREMTRAIKK
ncbi:MAG: tRNA (5-methylaminomethyl-2-thiouridine)(34)-methyltransferase MnmD [Bacteroidia bacterium]|nr:tRNA (5-methylaminomethyl-2-thiouridine)(34)-methyltransferase MnmD [Bacteroidia bacterium]